MPEAFFTNCMPLPSGQTLKFIIFCPFYEATFFRVRPIPTARKWWNIMLID